MTIADLLEHNKDKLGQNIIDFYGFNPPEYAVYSTDKRLLIAFADSSSLEADQRKGLAPLSPVRGEINGLIDGWRNSRKASLRTKARHYDRRVADALILALEHDVDSASAILAGIKQDIFEDRTSWARLEYLACSLAVSLVFILAVRQWAPADGARHLWNAAAAGALGAFFSIALNIRSRTVLPDLRRTSNITDAVLRVLTGLIGASALMALVDAKSVTVGFGPPLDPAAPETGWLAVLIVGFLAGFSERLVPDLLAKAAATPLAPAPSKAQAMPAADAGRIAATRADLAKDGSASAAVAQGNPQDDAGQSEAAVDHCICAIPAAPEEITQDHELPAASGGVAANGAGAPR